MGWDFLGLWPVPSVVNLSPNLEYFFIFNSPEFSKSEAGLSAASENEHIEIKVSPVFYQYNLIEWTIPLEWGQCGYKVYRSETEEGPWLELTNSAISYPFFKDTYFPEISKFNECYYLVECKLPDNRTLKSVPTSWENKNSPWVKLRLKEIQRRELILLNKFVGVDTIYFRRKRFGQRCSNCWDSTTEHVIKDHCNVCYGTSFEGGYYGGYNVKLQYEPTPISIEFGYQGKSEHNSIPAWTISIPAIESLDLVFRVPDRRLYRVGNKQTTELQTVPVRQILQLVELGKSSIEYNLINKGQGFEF